MPGPWIFLGDNRDFYGSLEISEGSYLETVLYDSSAAEQGYGLWRVVSTESKRKEGLWLQAKLIAASDQHLCWWLFDGPGKDFNRRFSLHLCVGPMKDCKKVKKDPQHEFHTDYFRMVDTGDLNSKVLS